MADDVEITAGSGTIIKTDQVGTDHVQYVKLMDGTADASTVIAADSSLGALYFRRRMRVTSTNATGSGAISASHSVSFANERLLSVTLHFNSAPTTSQNFTITLDANDGAAYDTLLFSIDPSASSATDIVWFPDGDLVLEAGDAIDLAYTNTDARTYGVKITAEAV